MVMHIGNMLRHTGMGMHVRNLFWSKKKPKFGQYAIVTPGVVSPPLHVPDAIAKPPYFPTGEPPTAPQVAEIKNATQVARMRDSCRLAANILKAVGDTIKVGMTTDEIDRHVHKLCIENNAYPSPLFYKGYPKSVCTSINNVACHGIPDNRPLHNGDIINIDVTVFYNGYHGDCSKTFLVGAVDEAGRQLVDIGEKCLDEAIALCKPQAKLCNLGTFIEKRVIDAGYNVVPCFLGHGIGEYFHGPPDVYHFTNDYPGVMQPGMTFTVEPIITQGYREVELLEDHWTAVTEDDARTAQFEHTVLITDDGCEVLTLADPR